MSLNPDIRDQAYQFFIEEAQELLQVLETGLLELRQDHSTPKVHELMRAAHSIKGGAASVELSTIGLLAHRLEDFFKALYSDEVDFDAELESLLLQGYDCLSDPLLAQIETGAFDEEAALIKAEPIFNALENRLSEALENADNYIPSSNDLGVDIVASIFEVDVAHALENLRRVGQNPSSYEPAEELTGTLEMFAGFAELFNLPGFNDIVQTALTALQLNPGNVLAILSATIVDCTSATEQVLAGDRQQGGTVSAALIELAQRQVAQSTIEPQTETLAGDIWSNDSMGDDIFAGDLDLAQPPEENIFAETTEELISTEFAKTAAKVDEISQIFDSLSDQTIQDKPAADTELDFQSLIGDADHLWSDLSEQPVPAAADQTSAPQIDEIAQIFDLVAQKESATKSDRAEINTDTEGLWSTMTDSETTENIFDAVLNFASEPESASTAVEPEDLATDWSEVPSDSDVDNIWSVIEPPAVESAPTVETQAPDSGSSPLKFQTDNSSSIFTAIEAIADGFEDLAVATPESLLPNVPKSEPSPKPQPNQHSSSPKKVSKLSVRVDLERLERMNNLVGELTINRNSLGLQNEQLQSNVSELEQKFIRFRGVTKQLQEVSDQMLLDARTRNALNSHLLLSSPTSKSNEVAEFDALELDSYSRLYSALQEILEEMVQLEESVEDITIFAQQSDRTISSQKQMLGQMRDELMWVRMLPLDRILQRFPRTIRDLASKYQKPVDLRLYGTGVLVDKAVLEKLSDPLLHLLRNGFDHGIEDSEIRIKQGKPPTGSIEIRAYHQGNQTVIEVKDDGKGLDLQRITQKGIEQGLITSREAASATPEQLYELIFEPGFSTAAQVSEISGRGVGMNIVRSQVETLKGKISVTSSPGAGSTFTLRLPLTLTIAKLLVCSLGTTAFAIPSDSIEEIIIPLAERLKIANGQKFLDLNGKLVPVYSLPKLLGYNCPVPDRNSDSNVLKTIAPPEDWASPLLLLRRGQKLFALEVVSLLSEQELVIKPYGEAISPPIYSYGCTILSDGSLIPAFDGSALIGMILGEKQHFVAKAQEVPEEDLLQSEQTSEAISFTGGEKQITAVKTIMVVDDSTALRRTMALTLEKEGYRVVQQKDGKEALNGFKQNPELDLIICDIEMPVMNGFEFLGMRRRDSALAQVPTFMLTSRSGAKHRSLAKQLGADGYFTKPYVEQDFVREIKQILTGNSAQNKLHRKETSAIKTKTILAIDDSSALRKTLALTLERKGYRVLQARDGNEGLEQLRNNLQTDLVICDVEMPNVNGFEFLTMRRAEAQLMDIPVVMLTSRGSDKHRTLANSLGAVGFFTKPYVEDQFIAEIEQYLRS
ncbi:MAG: hybrid sensor histidine kinase/response regulator [Cyanobacteria bacterium J06600_6]